MDSKDAKVLITGGTAGIGLAAAKLLVERGAKVAVCGRDADRLAKAEEEVPGIVTLQGDVGEEASGKFFGTFVTGGTINGEFSATVQSL